MFKNKNKISHFLHQIEVCCQF